MPSCRRGSVPRSVLARGTPDEVLSHPDVVASYLGTSQETIARSDFVSALATSDDNGRLS